MTQINRSSRFTSSILAVGVLAVGLFLGACGNTASPTGTNPELKDFVEDVVREDASHTLVVVDTNKGRFVIELYDNLTPKTVENFLGLVDRNFYNGLTFHLVQPEFLVQTGDPTGVGTGDSGTPPILLESHPDLIHDAAGWVGMAHVDKDVNSATSQFYITLSPQKHLDRKYAIFGKVVKGMDIVSRIQKTDVINFIERVTP